MSGPGAPRRFLCRAPALFVFLSALYQPLHPKAERRKVDRPEIIPHGVGAFFAVIMPWCDLRLRPSIPQFFQTRTHDQKNKKPYHPSGWQPANRHLAPRDRSSRIVVLEEVCAASGDLPGGLRAVFHHQQILGDVILCFQLSGPWHLKQSLESEVRVDWNPQGAKPLPSPGSLDGATAPEYHFRTSSRVLVT